MVTVHQPVPCPAPSGWEFDVLASDGVPVHVRPIRPHDGEAMRRFHSALSADTVYRRFFSPHPVLSDSEVERFTHVDYVDRFALVAEVAGELVAVARYDRTTPQRAEVAFVVADDQQGRGIGSLLLEQLACAARERGITEFEADTLTTNSAMRGVFRDAGFEVNTTFADGVLHFEFPIAQTEHVQWAVEERERHSQVTSMRRLLQPSTIAVIGASRREGTIGHEVLRNLLMGGFEGTVYPVNPGAEHVLGVHAYPTVADIPEKVDLGVVVVPAPFVVGAVEACGQAAVDAVVVISAGFAETGDEGRAREAELLTTVRRYGMRMVGPNCMGVANTSPEVRMNATFAPTPPRPGRVGLLSQSGAVGISLLERAARLGLGISTFVSGGNKADVSGNDMLQFWESDGATDVVLLYLESFGNPRKFARIARRVARSKPIVAVKSGRTAAGARAAQSHTGAAAAPDVASDALFRQAGVIRVSTMSEMFDVALVLANQPVPAGDRVVIVGNSGGPGIMAADACAEAGLALAELAPSTVEALRRFLPAEASMGNPVDLIAAATPEQYRQAIDVLLSDDGVDGAVVIFTPPLVTRPDDVAQAVVAAASAHKDKPVVAAFLTAATDSGVLGGGEGLPQVPVFPFPEQAVRALGHAAGRARWLRRPTGEVRPVDDVDHETARRVVMSALADAGPEGRWLEAAEVSELLGAFGVPFASLVPVADAATAVQAADRAGYPVVLKAAGAGIVHKTDLGGVVLDLQSANAVAEAYATMEAKLGDVMEGALVQPMLPAGVETIVGIANDPSFGPLVMFGLGGVATDLLGDRGFRILPLTDPDVSELVRSVRSAPLLFGYRGRPAVDVAAVHDVIRRVAALAEAVPEVAELDLNPLLVWERGATAVDARIRVRPVAAGPGPLSRRLR